MGPFKSCPRPAAKKLPKKIPPLNARSQGIVGSFNKWLLPTSVTILALSLMVFCALKLRVERDLMVDEFLLGVPEPTPVLRVENRAFRGSSLNAFLLHGLQCNKSMMVQLGKHLALNGVRAYLIDLPGHGASPVRFRGMESTYETVRGVLDEIIRREGIDPSSVSLVGHSFGGMIAAHIGLQDPRFRSHVLIGPGYEPGLTEKAPLNLLLLVGEYDRKVVNLAARQMLIRGTGGTVKDQDVFYGSFESGDARLLRVIPRTGHIELIYTPSVSLELLRWIFSSLAASSRTVEHTGGRESSTATRGIAVCMMILFVVLLAWGGRQFPQWTGVSSPYLSITPFSDFLMLIVTWLLALHLLSQGILLRFLSLEEGEVIFSLFFSAGALACLGCVVMRRRLTLRFTRRETVAVLMGIGVATGLYLLVAPFMTHELYHMEIKATRVWRFLAMSLLLLPFSLVTEGVFRGLQARKKGSWICGLESLFVGALYFTLLSLGLFFLGDRLERFAPILLGFAFCLQVIQTVLYACVPSTFLTGVFGSLIVSWLISTGFLIRG